MHSRTVVFHALARAGLGMAEGARVSEMQVGPVSLHAHQVEAVQRLLPLLNAHHGALLADTVGLGKTYVALAIASRYPSVDVLAPAGLVAMCRGVIAQMQVLPRPEVRSLHAFSSPTSHAPSEARRHPHLVIIDEAHHLRNPETRRYRAVAEWCRRAHVLLLSATPVHNWQTDLEHLLALFLGARARTLDDAQRTRFIVRRNAQDLVRSGHAGGRLPTMVAHEPFPMGDSAAVTRALSHIPPPLPTRHGRAAAALVALGLVRAWCSSGAACLSMIGRRRARAQALTDILAQGRWPTRQELRTWTVTEDTVQLGFTELLVDVDHSPPAAADLQQAREQLARHCDALSALAHVVRAVATPLDRTRVEAIRKVRALHRGVAVIAFSQFADTVRGIGRLMQWDAGVATLTSHGGRVAGGTMSREELLRRTAPRAHGVAAPAARDRIYLVLTTDLLAEGVNLQDAGVVLHLDLPWTPAAIAQREGRIARLGSLHDTVHAYGLSAPGGGAELMRLTARLRRKARAVSVALAPERAREVPRPLASLPAASSPLQGTLRSWQTGDTRYGGEKDTLVHDIADTEEDITAGSVLNRVVDSGLETVDDKVRIGAAHSARYGALHIVQHRRHGWLAAVHDPDCEAHRLCGGWFAAESSRTRATSDPRVLAQLVQAAHSASDHHLASCDLIEQYERSAERALRRQARAARAEQLVETVLSPVHRAQRHARRLLASVSLAERVRLSPQATLAVRTTRALRGAGDELALEQLLGETGRAMNIEEWFSAVIALAVADNVRSCSPYRSLEKPASLIQTLLLLMR